MPNKTYTLPDDLAAADLETSVDQRSTVPAAQPTAQSIDTLTKLHGSMLRYDNPTEPVWED
jgi:hypothetical protein